jgi:DNA-binding NtrC family response regulator
LNTAFAGLSAESRQAILKQVLGIKEGSPLSVDQHAVTFTNREAKIWTAERARDRSIRIPVLVIGPNEEDHWFLRKTLKPPAFHVQSARSLAEAAPLIRKARIPVIVAECTMNDCCWKDVWQLVQAAESRPRPRLIVTAAETCEDFWSEVMATGAYDVLEKPFDRGETVWVVTDAWTEWLREEELTADSKARAAQHGVA